jgi:hypothetical protein
VGSVSDPSAKIARAGVRAVSNITKGMSADGLAGIASDLDHIKGMQAELQKDWSVRCVQQRAPA